MAKRSFIHKLMVGYMDLISMFRYEDAHYLRSTITGYRLALISVGINYVDGEFLRGESKIVSFVMPDDRYISYLVPEHGTYRELIVSDGE